MILDDLIELEPLLSQYDRRKILVGPLLRLSNSSNFRYFYIAGKGSKVYGSIGLGAVEREEDAQRQRVEIIEKLVARFRTVTNFASHLEMTQAVHNLWPNEETARVLELAALDGTAEPAGAPGPNQNINDSGSAVSDSSGEPFGDVATGSPIDPVPPDVGRAAIGA
jgi:hypothetical protein